MIAYKKFIPLYMIITTTDCLYLKERLTTSIFDDEFLALFANIDDIMRIENYTKKANVVLWATIGTN